MKRLYRYLLLINVVTFFVRGYDKRMARINGVRLEKAGETRETQEGVRRRERVQTKDRISEKQLLILTALGGGVGAILGMTARRHKTKKGSFLRKIFAVLLVELSIILYIVAQ